MPIPNSCILDVAFNGKNSTDTEESVSLTWSAEQLSSKSSTFLSCWAMPLSNSTRHCKKALRQPGLYVILVVHWHVTDEVSRFLGLAYHDGLSSVASINVRAQKHSHSDFALLVASTLVTFKCLSFLAALERTTRFHPHYKHLDDHSLQWLACCREAIHQHH